MSSVDLRIVAVSLFTVLAYTVVANVIPQVESEVPLDIAFDADMTTEELVDAGRSLYEGAGGCVACHSEASGARGPNLLTSHAGEGPIGERCNDRVEGLSCKEYLYQALVRPLDLVTEGYPPIMPPSDRSLNPGQIWAIVAYLESLGGEVTVTADDIGAAEEAGNGPPAEAAPAPAAPTAEGGEALARELCVMCHQLGEEGSPMGPPLDGMGARLTAAEIRTKILNPDAFVSEGYENLAGVMPGNFGNQLTAGQLESMVEYLSGLR